MGGNGEPCLFLFYKSAVISRKTYLFKSTNMRRCPISVLSQNVETFNLQAYVF
jgi:hypothetical protein